MFLMLMFSLMSFSVFGQGYSPMRTSLYLGQEIFGNHSKDAFSFLRNSGALSQSGSGFGFYAENKYLMPGLHLVIASANFRHRKDGFGCWAGWTGTSHLSQFTAAAAFGKSLGKVDAGFELSYHAFRQIYFGTTKRVQASGGIIWSLSSVFKTTIQVSHFLPSRSSENGLFLDDLLIEWGWGYQVSPVVMVWMQAIKNASFPLRWEGGLQYSPMDRLQISGGWRKEQQTPWIGCTWRWDHLSCAIYWRLHPVLGFTPGVQWVYRNGGEK
jgi:hypothetical protein